MSQPRARAAKTCAARIIASLGLSRVSRSLPLSRPGAAKLRGGLFLGEEGICRKVYCQALEAGVKEKVRELWALWCEAENGAGSMSF